MIESAHKWKPITDIGTAVEELASGELRSLVEVWDDQRAEIESTESWHEFQQRLAREWSVETGLIERIYTLDRGVTRQLIEQGISAELIPHNSSGHVSPELAAAMIQDHKNVIEGLFDFVGGQRTLSTSYIKELHAELVRHQDTVTGVDHLGNARSTPLQKGKYKTLPNNPTRVAGTGIHEYCPPEHVTSEMDNLIKMHNQHDEIAPEVSAAWLHHRFVQIHPFQDGNGRVARCLATLVFLRKGLFPLIVRDVNGERGKYIDALECADNSDLKPLVNFFARCQQREISKAIGMANASIQKEVTAEVIIEAAEAKLHARQQRQQKQLDVAKQTAEKLLNIAHERMKEIKKHLEQSDAGFHAPIDLHPQSGEEDRGHYFRWQIIEGANELDYFANFSIHHQWLRLKIYLAGDTQTHMLLSFHGIGSEYRGILVCSATLFNRVSTDKDGSQMTPATLLSDEIFQINYRETEQSTIQRFKPWFESVLNRGLAFWQQSI